MTNNYSKLLTVSAVILILAYWQITPTLGAIGAKYTFELDPNGYYQMTAQAEAPLIWPENSQSEINVSITIDNVPNDNVSGITIVAINYFLQLSRDDNESVLPESLPKVYNQNIKNESETITFSELFDAPTLANEFVVRIELLAITTGNLTQDINNPPSYTFFFPDSGSIFVERSQAQALINLYGFPPTSYMLVFGAIMLGLSSPMLIPAIISFGYFGKDWLSQRQKRREINQVGPTEKTEQHEEVQ